MSQDIHLHFARFFPDYAIRPFAYLLSKRLEEGHICLAIPDEDLNTQFGPV